MPVTDIHEKQLEVDLSSVALTPGEGTVETVFDCAFQDEASDKDNDDLSYEFTWYVNEHNTGVNSASVVAIQLERDDSGTPATGGDLMTCAVRAFDGEAWSDWKTATALELENTPPAAESVVISPVEAWEEDELTCTAISAPDPDGDPVTWTYRWTVNGAELSIASTSTLDGAHFDRGDQDHAP